MKTVLPDPCPHCSGPVYYSGRGRRPEFCSSACREAVKVEGRRLRRARDRGDVRPEDLEDVGARLESDGSRWSVPESSLWDEAHDHDDYESLGFTTDGYVERQARGRDRDPAAAWLAENAPEELADFGLDY